MKSNAGGSMLPRGGGVLLVDKAQGVTSHDVVNAMRGVIGIKAVGHTGTLDPMATGLLVMCLGPATKLSPYLSGQEKEYLGTVTFGAVSNTLDATGVLERRSLAGGIDKDRVTAAMAALTGDIDQVPPMTSAVKVDGVRLHKLARQGIEVSREPRRVRVKVFEPARIGDEDAEFRVVCSSGTYVRCLAADVGEALGCGGYLSSLRRVRVGRFNVADARTVDELSAEGVKEILAGRVIPPAQAVDFLPFVVLDGEGMRTLRNGAVCPAGAVTDRSPGLGDGTGAVRVLDQNGGLSAIGAVDEASGGIRPVRVLKD
jgi:tRNA pseudouridine55 synthase